MRGVPTAIAILAALPVILTAQTPAAGGGQPPRPPLTLTTTAWPDGGQIPAKYTQAGEHQSVEMTSTFPPIPMFS